MKRLKKFTNRQIRALVAQLKKYGSSPKPETLHQVRVSIKKIKAVIGVIGECRKGFKAHKNFMPFRRIFRMAGDIRDPDVLHQLLQRYQVQGIDDDRKLGNMERLASSFESDIPQFITMVESRANKLETSSDKVHRNDFKKYLRQKKKEVKSQLYPRPKMAVLHKVRKSIKEVIYLSNVKGKLKRKEAKFYDTMQDTIGQFHDKQMLLDVLKTKNDKADTKQCKQIKSECLSDKKEISRLVRTFYG